MSQVERVDRVSVDITVKHKSCSRYAQRLCFSLLLIFNFAVPPKNYHIQIARLAYHLSVLKSSLLLCFLCVNFKGNYQHLR